MIVRGPLPLLNLRIFLTLGECRVRTLKGALQLRHLRRSVGDLVDAYCPAAVRPQLNGNARILDDNDSRMSFLGANLEDAVLEVAVVDGAVVKESEVRGRGFEVVNERQRQRAEGETADADRRAGPLECARPEYR